MKFKIVLLFERRIEVAEKMVNTPFVKMRCDESEGDAVFAVHGGKVEYTPEKVDMREVNGQVVLHKVIAAETHVASITAPDGTVYRQDAGVDVTIDPVE
jgi:hypothetical protein